MYCSYFSTGVTLSLCRETQVQRVQLAILVLRDNRYMCVANCGRPNVFVNAIGTHCYCMFISKEPDLNLCEHCCYKKRPLRFCVLLQRPERPENLNVCHVWPSCLLCQ